jgi:hypothetical protein
MKRPNTTRANYSDVFPQLATHFFISALVRNMPTQNPAYRRPHRQPEIPAPYPYFVATTMWPNEWGVEGADTVKAGRRDALGVTRLRWWRPREHRAGRWKPQGATPSSTGSRVRGLPGWEAEGDPARAITLNHAIPTAALTQAVNSSSASAPQMTASRRPGAEPSRSEWVVGVPTRLRSPTALHCAGTARDDVMRSLNRVTNDADAARQDDFAPR